MMAGSLLAFNEAGAQPVEGHKARVTHSISGFPLPGGDLDLKDTNTS